MGRPPGDPFQSRCDSAGLQGHPKSNLCRRAPAHSHMGFITLDEAEWKVAQRLHSRNKSRVRHRKQTVVLEDQSMCCGGRAMTKPMKAAALLLMSFAVMLTAQNKEQGSKPSPAPEMQRVAKMLVGTWKVVED